MTTAVVEGSPSPGPSLLSGRISFSFFNRSFCHLFMRVSLPRLPTVPSTHTACTRVCMHRLSSVPTTISSTTTATPSATTAAVATALSVPRRLVLGNGSAAGRLLFYYFFFIFYLLLSLISDYHFPLLPTTNRR